MTTTRLRAIGCILVWAAIASGSLAASLQESPGGGPVSMVRIRKALEAPPAPRLKLDSPPAATFRVTTEQRVFMPSFEEHLRREFALNHFQRQSQEWRSKCCGINLLAVPEHLIGALHRRNERAIKERIAMEAAALEAAATK